MRGQSYNIFTIWIVFYQNFSPCLFLLKIRKGFRMLWEHYLETCFCQRKCNLNGTFLAGWIGIHYLYVSQHKFRFPQISYFRQFHFFLRFWFWKSFPDFSLHDLRHQIEKFLDIYVLWSRDYGPGTPILRFDIWFDIQIDHSWLVHFFRLRITIYAWIFAYCFSGWRLCQYLN